MRTRLAFACVIIGLLAACGDRRETQDKREEDLTAKQMLQGIWVDEETELPLMRVEGDTVYYSDPLNMPVSFRIVRDSIYLCGQSVTAYKIDRQTENSFWFRTLSDGVIRLRKSEDTDELVTFVRQTEEPIPILTEVIKKDSVVMYANRRYHGYVYINPSTMKVIKTTVSEDGINVDNVYYDNIIHISVYEGKKMLYGCDISKKMFAHVLPAELLSGSILTDMDFQGVDAKGFRFQATVRTPGSPVYHLLDLTVDEERELCISKVE